MHEQKKAGPQTAQQPSGPALKRWAPIALLAAAGLGVYLSGASKYLSLETIAENRQALQTFVAANWLTAVGAYTLLYVAVTVFIIPGAALLTIVGGFLFGWFNAGIVTVIGATIGATAVFLIVQTSFGHFLSQKAGPWMTKFSDGIAQDAFNYLLFLRLVPIFPFFVVNIAPGLFKVKLSTYVITTLIGIIPGTFAFTILGSGLNSIIDAQRKIYDACVAANGAGNCVFKVDAGSLITPQILAAFAALGIVAAIPVVLRRLKQRGTRQQS